MAPTIFEQGVENSSFSAFFNTMVPVVVKITSPIRYNGTTLSTKIGTGVVVSDRSCILTCNHIFTNPASATLASPREVLTYDDWCGAKNLSFNVEIEDRSEFADLALLRPVGDQAISELAYAEFAPPNEELTAGQRVYIISMVSTFDFTYEELYISMPLVRFGELPRGREDADLDYNEDLEVIQIAGIARGAVGGRSGAPIFDSRGRIIGIAIFEWGHFLYAVPAHIVLQFMCPTAKA